jgi:hypothetical protein
MLFYSLRERLGAGKFIAALREFWERHRFQRASFDDLAAAFERASGENLSSLFRQWLDTTGAPWITAKARNIGPQDSPGLVITLSQDLPDRASRVPVRVIQTTGWEDLAIELDGSSVAGEFAIRARATALAVDPAFTVWRRLQPEESPPILRDAVAAADLEVLALDPGLKQPALEFGKAFAEGEVKAAGNSGSLGGYLLVAGAARLVDNFLRERGIDRPHELTAGDSQVWVVPDRAQRLMLVSLPVRIDDAKAMLTMLGRRLPHVSRYSWLTFERGKTADRGTWPAESPRIPVR